MQRKWRTNRWALDTVLAHPVFRESIPPRDAEYTLADPTDLYAVYTVLHIENKQSELRWSPHGRFYYFLAQWEQAQTADGRQAQQTAAPEGDEDPPPQVRAPVPTPDVSNTAPRISLLSFLHPCCFVPSLVSRILIVRLAFDA